MYVHICLDAWQRTAAINTQFHYSSTVYFKKIPGEIRRFRYLCTECPTKVSDVK
jgi:hypothetical protein